MNAVVYHSQGGAAARATIRRHEFYFYDARQRFRWIHNFREEHRAEGVEEKGSKGGEEEEEGGGGGGGGHSERRDETLQEALEGLEEREFVDPGIYKFDVLVTSFEVLMQDLEFLNRIRWGLVIVDEGQRLKNAQGKLNQGMEEERKRERERN